MRIGRQDRAELALARRRRKILDERRRGREEGIEAVLDRAVGDGDRQVRLARAAGTAEDERLALGDEVGAAGAAEQREADDRLDGEIVLVDRLEERRVGAMNAR